MVRPGQVALVESSVWFYPSAHIFVVAVGNLAVYGIEIASGDLTIQTYRFNEWSVIESGSHQPQVDILVRRFHELTTATFEQVRAMVCLGEMLNQSESLAYGPAPKHQTVRVHGSQEGQIVNLTIPAGVTEVILERWIENDDDDSFDIYEASFV